MKNKKIPYLLMDIMVFFILSIFFIIFSKSDFIDKITFIAIIFAVNIFVLLLFILVNYFWYRTFGVKIFIFMNYFWIIGSIIMVISIIFIEINSILKSANIELFLFIFPIITILLLNIYIKNNIIRK